MNVFSWLWIGWLLLFGVVETIALRNRRKGDTLSENLRALFHTNTVAGRFVWIAFLSLLFGWLVVHIAVVGAA